MRFNPGQKVVCIRPNGPYKTFTGSLKGRVHNYGPKFNEIVTVWREGCHKGFILLSEYLDLQPNGKHSSYDECRFEPLIDDAVITELLEESLQPAEI